MIRKNIGKYIGMDTNAGLMFPSSIAVGVAIGYGLDRLFNTAPVLLIVFFFYGAAAGFYNLYKISKGARRDDHDKKQ